MFIFKTFLIILLVIIIITKAHMTFIEICVHLFLRAFPRTSHFLYVLYNSFVHLYKCTSKKTKIILLIGLGILLACIKFGIVVLFICGVAGISFWLGYKIVHRLSSWVLFSCVPTKVPMFMPPKDFSAAQIHFVINDKWTKETTCISLIQMIANGFLKATTQETNTSEGFKISTYTLSRTPVLPQNEDESLYDAIVGPDSILTLNNDINPTLNFFHKQLADLTSQKTKEIIYHKYGFQKYFRTAATCCLILGYILHPLDVSAYFGFAFIILGAIGSYTAKNKKNPVFKDIAGLKMFLKAVCKNENLNINSSSIKDVLPYALAMDIPKAWNKLILSLNTREATLSPFIHPDFKQLVFNAITDIETKNSY